MQDATLRAWKALKRFEGRSSLRSWLYTIATNTCLTQIQRRPEARAAGRLRPVDGPVRGPGPADHRDGLDRAVPGHRPRGRPGRPGRPLRAAREHRAGVHRRAPAPARLTARGADPPRGARLLRQGGRRGDGDERPERQQRAPARPRVDRGARPRPEPAGDAQNARRRRDRRDRQDLRRRVGAQRRRGRRRAADRGRRDRDAAAGELVRPARRVRDVPGATSR